MSDTDHSIVCPNCGSHATGNYCPECGQKTHLHKETFWGLVAHFIGDYFHYDSKFWQTLKALWFSPGKLTIAYWNKQRMRYIPPVSLYIFISALYFLVSFSTDHEWIVKGKQEGHKTTTVTGKGGGYDIAEDNPALGDFLDKKAEKIKAKYGDVNSFIIEKANHNLPKIFFFMIPVMALILKLLFFKRRNSFFVDHAIFSLHYHSFWFSIFLIGLFPFSSFIENWITFILVLIATYYMVVAIHNAYKTSWLRSFFYSVIIGISYSIILVAIFIVTLFSIVILA